MSMTFARRRGGAQVHRSLGYLRHHLVTLSVAVVAVIAWVLWYPHRPRGLAAQHAGLTLVIGVGVIVGCAVVWLAWHSRRVRLGLGADGLAATGTLVAVAVVFLIGAAVELLAVLKGIAPHGLHQTMLVMDVLLASVAALASRMLGGPKPPD